MKNYKDVNVDTFSLNKGDVVNLVLHKTEEIVTLDINHNCSFRNFTAEVIQFLHNSYGYTRPKINVYIVDKHTMDFEVIEGA